MLRVAIVGCGKIADQHIHAIQRVPGSAVVATCDQEPMMATQLAERFGIERHFDDVAAMLAEVAPDVVHITTPPQSHATLGEACLDAGSHVYLEKPFTIDAAEAERLIAKANGCGRSISPGHNYQFTPEMLRMRRLVESGFLGGRPTHLECHWSYDLGDASYVGPLLGNPAHWVRRLPGQLIQNLISHGIARLAEFLDDDVDLVLTSVHQSAKLRAMGGREVMDELRVLIRDRGGLTANFCFSTGIKPGLNRFEVFGPSNSLLVDLSSGSVVESRGKSHKSYLTFLVPPVVNGRGWLANAWRNARAIAGRRLYQDSGMAELIARYHRSIVERLAPPIPYREVLLTARIMDRIFADEAFAPRGPGRDDGRDR
jgi:predicted dehydrogenase